ncbi:hypothetical protein FBQ87_09515 [Sphingobacteriales bacterium CHB3]|nr:hypothetical protein [Sphingobacteriales bacterium CHB3]
MKEIFQAVHSSELLDFISKLGLLERFNSGTITCHACGDIITVENFKVMTRKDDRLLFSCTKEKCLLALASPEAQ